MKAIFSLRSAIGLAALVLLSASCKKTIERDLEKEEDRMMGQWTLEAIRYVTTDSLGKTVADSTVSNQGTVEFRMATDVDADVFNPVLFEGLAARSELVSYFRGFSAGDPTTSGGWALYWDADPAAKRVIIWGIGPSSSFHRVMNLEYDGDGKGERTMWYTNTSAGSPGTRHFVYYDLRK